MTPPHGSRYRYAAGCGCPDCHGAHRAYLNRRNRRRAMGRGAYTEAEPVRAHVRSLMAAGMGYPQLAKVSGVDQSSLVMLMCGRSSRGGQPARRMSSSNARVLWAVAVPDLADGARVVHVGAARRGQALVAAGWGMSPLARELGMSVTIVRRVVYGRPVWKASADRVVAAYDRLWDRLPPQGTARGRAAVTQARQLAARHGWVPPQAWDDHLIDDPAGKPDVGLRQRSGLCADDVEVSELLAGHRPADAVSKASREVAYRALLERGMTVTAVAERLQVSRRSVERARARLGAERGQDEQQEAS